MTLLQGPLVARLTGIAQGPGYRVGGRQHGLMAAGDVVALSWLHPR